MSDSERCIHDMEQGTCAICTPRGEPEGPLFGSAPVVKANFPSQCSECFHQIHIGDPITKGEYGQWMHVDCP